jgi:predicted ArsR family transcriptional regulator
VHAADNGGVKEVSLIDAAPPQVAGRRREALDCLHEAAHPLAAAEVARRTGLQLSTARFHLDALVADGLVDRTTEERSTPGRRRILYTVRADASGPRGYGLLAEMLADLVTTAGGPDSSPIETGRAWGRHLVHRPAPPERRDAETAVAPLVRMLDAMGFRPRERTDADRTNLHLRHCPFREVALRHPEVVCAIHLGIMQGALADLHGPLEIESLDPFVTPDVCVARLRPVVAA